jgi:hypothetical protein
VAHADPASCAPRAVASALLEWALPKGGHIMKKQQQQNKKATRLRPRASLETVTGGLITNDPDDPNTPRGTPLPA